MRRDPSGKLHETNPIFRRAPATLLPPALRATLRPDGLRGRKNMKNTTGLALVALAAPLLIAAVILPQWQQQLQTQLKNEQKCDVKNFSQVKMGVKNGKEAVQTRVSCEDKRVFDASRVGHDGPFDLKCAEGC
jgi:ferric-dicitrate binding protein FerR (iron transport regulator)